jgi:hypothetical protein
MQHCPFVRRFKNFFNAFLAYREREKERKRKREKERKKEKERKRKKKASTLFILTPTVHQSVTIVTKQFKKN